MQKQIVSLIRRMSGQANILTIPRVYIDLLKSHRAALLLSQCVYWSDKTTDPDGWFYKSYAEWRDEIGLNQHALDTAREICERGGFVQTKIERNNGTNKTFWRVDFDKLSTALVDLAETSKPDLAENYKSTYRHRLLTACEEKSQLDNSVNSELAEVFAAYQSNISVTIGSMDVERITDAVKQYGAKNVMGAIDRAVSANARRWAYIAAVLRNWEKDGPDSKPASSRERKPVEDFV